MNVYVLVEGRKTEKIVYRSWLTFLFNQLKEVYRVEDIGPDNFYMLSGGGYPSYRDRIKSSVEDINEHGNIDHFLVCVDAEELTLEEKIEEIYQLATGIQYAQLHVVVHDCCIETWFLGNREIVRRPLGGFLLRQYVDFYDVVTRDPEKMPKFEGFTTRAQFHCAYLRKVFRECGSAYSKKRPIAVKDLTYFRRLEQRFRTTGHIQSFGRLLSVLRGMGAEC